MSNITDEHQTEYEMRKISGGVFDKSTLTSINELIRRGYLDELTGIISTGKEANVYHAILGEKELAVKLYLIDTSDFRRMDRYIKGDRRFSSRL